MQRKLRGPGEVEEEPRFLNEDTRTRSAEPGVALAALRDLCLNFGRVPVTPGQRHRGCACAGNTPWKK